MVAYELFSNIVQDIALSKIVTERKISKLYGVSQE